MAHWWSFLAPPCYSHVFAEKVVSSVSSSGGGLPERPMTRKSRALVLFCGCFHMCSNMFPDLFRGIPAANLQFRFFEISASRIASLWKS
jgi:hypothetical protein